MTAPPTLDPALGKQVLRMIPHGVYVVTARCDTRVAAATIDWVTQASGNPPLLVSCLRQDSFVAQLVKEAQRFALNLLGDDQKEFAAQFFRYRSASETEINSQRYRLGQTGAPILEEAAAALELELIESLDRFDHSVMIGQVVAVHCQRPALALLLRDTGWNYSG